MTTRPSTQPSVATSRPADVTRWWSLFDDPTLDSLVERAAQGNLDLRQAEARIVQARASRGIAVADLWPTVGLSGAYARNGTSGRLQSSAYDQPSLGDRLRSGVQQAAVRAARSAITGTQQQTGTNTGATGSGLLSSGSGSSSVSVPQETNAFRMGLDATWELDVFGGKRRAVEAANAEFAAAVEDRRDVLVILVSEVALNYVNLRGVQRQIAVAHDNLRVQESAATLTRRRFQAGFTSGLDVANAEAQVASVRAAIPTLEAGAVQAIYALSVLLGREPAALVDELLSAEPIPAVPPEVPVGLPSELLRRRPDIHRAEARLHAAVARIGVAADDLFPQFSLSGSLGLQGDRIQSLGNWQNRVWSFGPGVDWTLFDGGRIVSNVILQDALAAEALFFYERTILTALQEVESALAAYSAEQDRHRALVEAVGFNRRAVELATRLYTQGQTDFLNVLTAERSLYVAEDALAQSDRTMAANLVAVYKALGGGWDIAPRPAGPTTRAASAHRSDAPFTLSLQGRGQG